MAIITGLPNFFNATGPAASDFNNAAKAICTQLGGTYWDEGLGQYVFAAGNLDTNNIAAQAGFKNCQKSEPRYTFQLSSTAISNGTTFIDGPIFGPVPYEYDVLAIGIGSVDATSYYVTGGVFDVYLNGRIFSSGLGFPNSTAGTPSDYVFTPFALSVRPGDWILIDLAPAAPAVKLTVASANRVAGTAPTNVAPSVAAVVTLYCSAKDSA